MIQFGVYGFKNNKVKTFEKIYKVVSKIPKGKVATYKQIAKLSGVESPRVVGFAMRANKNIHTVPCHRVVGSDGKLHGYSFGGVEKKKELLEKEGVPFLENNRVNLKTCLFSY